MSVGIKELAQQMVILQRFRTEEAMVRKRKAESDLESLSNRALHEEERLKKAEKCLEEALKSGNFEMMLNT